MFKKLKKRLEEVAEIKTSPHSIAAGFAIGTLIAILPTFGLGIFIGLAVVFIFKKVSKISLLISFVVWNPAVLFSLYPLSYRIGDLFLANIPVHSYKIQILNQIFVHSRRFLVGSVVLAVTVAIASYLVILILADFYQRKKIKGLKEEAKELKKTLEVK